MRQGRLAIAGAFAALGVMAFGASSAQAATQNISITYQDAILSLPAPAGNSDILNPPNEATMTGTVDDATNALNIPANQFVFPGFDGSLSGIPLHVEFDAVDQITGTASLTTGALTTVASTYHTNVTLGSPLNADCDYNSEESFQTGAGTPFNGDPFTVAPTGDPRVFTDGIAATNWGSGHFALVANTGDCSLVTNIINSGCGGLALANGLTPTPGNCNPPSNPGNPTSPVNPAGNIRKRKCKKAKKGSAEIAKKKKCKKKKK